MSSIIDERDSATLYVSTGRCRPGRARGAHDLGGAQRCRDPVRAAPFHFVEPPSLPPLPSEDSLVKVLKQADSVFSALSVGHGKCLRFGFFGIRVKQPILKQERLRS